MGLCIRPPHRPPSLFRSLLENMNFLLLLFLGAAATTAEKNKTSRLYYTANGFPQTSVLQYGSRVPASTYQVQGNTNLGGLSYQASGGYPFYVNYQQQALANQNLQSPVVQVPQSGLVPASTLAGTYGAGAYGAYGSLYGSSLPFLPSVFYRTRTRLASTEGENATIGENTNQDKDLGFDTAKASKD